MKTDQEKIEVMQAHVAGNKIEALCRDEYRAFKVDYLVWTCVENPDWNWTHYDYRIAREPRVIWVNEYRDGTFGQGWPSPEEARAMRTSDGLRCVKFVEVMEDGE